MPKTALIIGSTSFIGRNFKVTLEDAGWIVFGTVREPATQSTNTFHLDFGNLKFSVFEGAPIFDVCIYMAWSFDPRDDNVRIHGEIFRYFQNRAKRHVFISSFSAHANNSGKYGREKASVEKLFLDSGQSVIRPGLVIGIGGLSGELFKLVRSTFIVPSFPKEVLVPVVGIQDLVKRMQVFLDGHGRQENVFHQQLVAFPEILKVMGQVMGKRRTIFEVPLPLINLAATFFRLAGQLKLADSLTSAFENKNSPYEGFTDSQISGQSYLESIVKCEFGAELK